MRTRGRRSLVWNHFNRTSDKFVSCQLCNRDFKYFGNTTNLKEHLKRKHNLELTVPGSNDELAVDEIASSITTEPLQVHKFIDSDPFIPAIGGSLTAIGEPPAAKRPRTMRSPNFTGEVLLNAEKESIEESLVKMIVQDYLPLSIVENEGFVEYSRKLQPQYNLPSKNFFSKILPELYNKIALEVKSMLQTVANVAITTETWTSDNSKTYITVTGHFIYGDQLHAQVFANRELRESDTVENVASTLSSVFEEWSVSDKIVIIVSDNESYLKNIITEHLSKAYHPCVAHTLDLSANEAACNDGTLTRLIAKCMDIVEYFNHNNVASGMLRDVQNQMNLPQLKLKDSNAKWNSCLRMMERLLALKTSLQTIVETLPILSSFPDIAEWDIISDYVSIFKLLEMMTVELSTKKYPTMSIIIPLIRGLQYQLQLQEPRTQTGELLRNKLTDAISQRLGSLETNRLVAQATFLDPRFKKTAFGIERNANNAEKWVIEELTDVINMNANEICVKEENVEADDSNGGAEYSIWTHFDRKVSQDKTTTSNSITTAALITKKYLDLPLVPRTNNPLDFWSEHNRLLPELYQLAKKYMCIPATSVPSESVFSSKGQCINERRKQLPAKNLEYIIFLNGNM